MNKKKVYPFGDPMDDGFEYLCPTAARGERPGLVPAETDGDPYLESSEDLHPSTDGKSR